MDKHVLQDVPSGNRAFRFARHAIQSRWVISEWFDQVPGIEMSLRNRVRAIAIIVTVAWVLLGLWLLPKEEFGAGWILLSAILSALIGLTIVNLAVRPHLMRLRRALAEEDIPTAQQEFAVLSDFFRLRGREKMKVYGINILILEERYQEALAGLEALNTKRVGKKGVPVITNQIAWCTAQLGKPVACFPLCKRDN